MHKPSTETFTGIWAALGAIALVFALLALTGCGSKQATADTRWVAYKQTVGSYDGTKTPGTYMLVDRDTGVEYLVIRDGYGSVAITPIYDNDGKVRVMDE